MSQSFAEWSVLVESTPQEYREYHGLGKVFVDYLAARIHYFVGEYTARDLSRKLGAEVTRAIKEWRATQT